jgi:hypothetical protein
MQKGLSDFGNRSTGLPVENCAKAIKCRHEKDDDDRGMPWWAGSSSEGHWSLAGLAVTGSSKAAVAVW